MPSPMLVYPATVGNRTSIVVTQHSAANIALRTSIRMVSFLFFIPEYLSCWDTLIISDAGPIKRCKNRYFFRIRF